MDFSVHPFAVGTSVEVFYNPARPKSATLDTRVDNRVLTLVFFAGLTIACFAGAALGGLFAEKNSVVASLSSPLLIVSLLAFVMVIVIAVRQPGERLVGVMEE